MSEGGRVLADYWEGHGHPGPSHGRERDEIAWGTPGDFDRCVALVTRHGKMTPEQAKGYCNLRHHGALGYWPAQHAEMERGKMADVDPLRAWERVRAALDKASGQATEIHVTGEGDTDHDGDGLFDADGDGDGAVAVRVKQAGPRNPRDTSTGRFRTFQGEAQEARQALAEGRVQDAIDLIGSARTLATDDRQRLILGELQGAIGRIRHVQPEMTKDLRLDKVSLLW